jgi:hypothetical protein
MPGTWPAGVPYQFDAGSFEETPPDPFLRTENENSAIFKAVRISATAYAKCSGSITMTRLKLIDLLGFYENNGAIDFTGLEHPLTFSVSNSWMFREVPKFRNIGYDLWLVTLSLARLT